MRGPKVYAISRSLQRGAEALLAEVKKCDVVCSNCHRIRTLDRRRDGSARREKEASR